MSPLAETIRQPSHCPEEDAGYDVDGYCEVVDLERLETKQMINITKATIRPGRMDSPHATNNRRQKDPEAEKRNPRAEDAQSADPDNNIVKSHPNV
jgi:hypothetical protein